MPFSSAVIWEDSRLTIEPGEETLTMLGTWINIAGHRGERGRGPSHQAIEK